MDRIKKQGCHYKTDTLGYSSQDIKSFCLLVTSSILKNLYFKLKLLTFKAFTSEFFDVDRVVLVDTQSRIPVTVVSFLITFVDI